MSQDSGRENLQRQSDLYKETQLGGKPFLHCVLPLAELPIHDHGSRMGLPMNPDFTRAVAFISDKISTGELRLALEKPTSFAFRGLTRVLGSKEYEATIHSIEEYGVDRGGPNTDKTWFGDELDLPLRFAIPRRQQQVGLLIVSRAEGMIIWGDDFSKEGVRLKEGYSFKDLHVGTIQIVVDPPMNK